MSPDEAEKIRERRFGGIKPNDRALVGAVRCLGFDIETSVGVPYSLALYCEEAGLDQSFVIRRGQGLLKLLDTASQLDAQGRDRVLVGAHFLGFDLGVLVYDYLLAQHRSWDDLDDREQIDLDLPHGRFHLRMGKVIFATLKTEHRTIHFINTAHYFNTSLDKAAASLGLTLKKFPKPKFLGLRTYAQRVIGKYNRQDARMVWALLKQIVAWWRQWEIRPAISAPQMAARVFCHAYVKRPWVRLPEGVKMLALLSYHGGKNGIYTRPGWHRRVYAYDLRSAYVDAMTRIPPMDRGEWRWSGAAVPGAWGFVVVTGRMPEEMRAPIFYTHDFRPLAAGAAFATLCVTSLEYDLLRRLYPRWRPDEAISVNWYADAPGPSDLARYARDMFERRRTAETEEANLLYKLLGNSLYGKFIARHPDDEREDSFLAGQLFYPPVASWITAMVRCEVTRLEYSDVGVLHTSTDGIITRRPLPASEVGAALGQWKFEHAGPCLILRNKLYLHFDARGRLVKWALHGFQGEARDLWRLLQTGRDTYTVDRLGGWRESARDGDLPYAPKHVRMTLHLPEIRTMRKEGRANPFRLRPKF
jgi:hypothetical protein